jgi:hypothetical protein
MPVYTSKRIEEVWDGVYTIEAATKEMKQLHDRTCFQLILVSELTATELTKAQEGLMFLTEKETKRLKVKQYITESPPGSGMIRKMQ